VSDVIVRDTHAGDVLAIRRIYAYHVLTGLASFEETPPDEAELAHRRTAILDRGLPYLAAEADGRVVGYAYAAPFRPRLAYRHTVENSVYVAEGMERRGIGRLLLTTLIERCTALGLRQMVAVIGDTANTPSIRLHEDLGFRRVGSLLYGDATLPPAAS
jgi:phosphinothricin acetyltransferase